MSRVDVIVPCYKYAHFLRECVESILSQSLTDVRVLIVDDASPDHTPEVAAELVARDKRVEYRRHSVNHGHIATYNEGLDWAAGDYTLLLSADDLLTPGSLYRAVRLLDAHPGVGLVYGRGIKFQSDQPPPRVWPASEDCGWKILMGIEYLEYCCARISPGIESPTAVVCTRLQKQLGGYREELFHTGDMEMWMRFAVHASVGILDADQAYVRLHNKNMSNIFYTLHTETSFLTALPDLRQRKAAFDTLFQYYGNFIADRERIQHLADCALSRVAFETAYWAFEQGNLSCCQETLDFALDINPELRNRPEYARLRWKLRVGPRVWSALRPIYDIMHGRPVQRSESLC